MLGQHTQASLQTWTLETAGGPGEPKGQPSRSAPEQDTSTRGRSPLPVKQPGKPRGLLDLLPTPEKGLPGFLQELLRVSFGPGCVAAAPAPSLVQRLAAGVLWEAFTCGKDGGAKGQALTRCLQTSFMNSP